MTEEKSSMMNDSLIPYFAATAAQRDRVYDKPERQRDLAEMRAKVAELLRGHHVLELACGAGYWTEVIAGVAASVVATDVNPAMLAQAAARGLPDDKVQWNLVDAFDLPADVGRFSACFAGCWWSHVKREDQERFLAELRGKLGKDVLLVLLDNVYVDGSSTSIARTDAEGNTYQIHSDADGQRYEVVKNFPSDSTLRKKLGGAVREIRISRLDHYWLLSCRLK